jgi:hypothetical protein
MSSLQAFVDKARSHGLDDKDISGKLKAAGWSEVDINGALNDLVVPRPGDDLDVPTPNTANNDARQRPIAVVHNLSVRGFEYSIMFISLIASAFSFGVILLSLIGQLFNNPDIGTSSDSGTTSFFITLLIVVFPIFVLLFLRLKKAEISDPQVRLDPSRRKWLQFTQLVSFLVGIGFIVAFVYQLFNYSSNNNPNVLQQLIDTLVVIAIAGSIFTYYWLDEHKAR